MLKQFASMFSASEYIKNVPTYPDESFLTLNLEVNEKTVIQTSYYAFGDKYDAKIFAKVAPTILSGDTLLMFVSSHNKETALPYGFKEILSTSGHDESIHLKCGYKVWKQNDDLIYPVTLLEDTFVNLITIRGTKFIVDAKGRISNSCSSENEIVSPRAFTTKGGAVISAFAYDEPHGLKGIAGQHSLCCIENNHSGLAVGVSSSDGGISRRIRAISNSKCGGGDDIAFSIALH